MAISVVMPALEIAQETGTLIAWRKEEGEQIAKGETLLEIETDKAVMEIEAPGNGVLVGVKVHEGAVVPVGQIIAWIVAPGEALPPEAVPSNTTTPTATTRARAEASVPNTTHQPVASVAKISPKARRLARERGGGYQEPARIGSCRRDCRGRCSLRCSSKHVSWSGCRTDFRRTADGRTNHPKL